MKKILVIILLIVPFVMPIIIFAHSIPLEVGYDKCIKTEEINEDYKWYKIYNESNGERSYSHLSDNVQTVKYWIGNVNPDSGYTWTSDISEDIANEIKSANIESIMKWNNVYYYTYENGVRISNKVINIEPAESFNEATLIIYPSKLSIEDSFVGVTKRIGDEPTDLSILGNYHFHYYKHRIDVTVDYFYAHDANEESSSIQNTVTETQALLERERVGAHEFGHVLGLYDVDIDCDDDGEEDETDHHINVIMGYGNSKLRTTNITYQDIAGVSITRGFHTDNDHVWMKRVNANESVDLICAQCNGVLYNVDISSDEMMYEGKVLNEYKSCTHHGGNNEKMLLVATNGEQDFYKCQYCRYIETIEKVNEYEISSSNSFHISYGMVPDKKEIYELNITEQNSYIFNFVLQKENEFKIQLYDHEFKKIYMHDINKTKKIYHYVKNLSPGKYFIEIHNYNIVNNINGCIFSKENESIISNGTNNILTSQYSNIKQYYFNNTQGNGIYKISLNGKYPTGSNLSVINNTIKLYNSFDRENLLYRLSDDLSQKIARNNNNENTMYVYLPENNLYYIDINLPDDDYLELEINIEKVIETSEIALNNESNLQSCNEIELICNVDEKFEWFKMVKIYESGIFYATLSYVGSQTDNVELYILKEIENNNDYSLEVKYQEIINSNDSFVSCYYELEEGNYYIGYSNLNQGIIESMTITREVVNTTDSINSGIIVDPSSVDYCGTQISMIEKNLINKSYRETFITKGFTRHIYLDILYAPSESRIAYDWYSSNEDVLEVTEYGTVLGKSIGTAKIFGIYKNNPAIIFVKEFTVIDNLDETPVRIDITQNYTIGSGPCRLNLNSLNSPFPKYQYYNIIVITPNAKSVVDAFGRVLAIDEETIIVRCQYKLNLKYYIYITLTITKETM